MTRSTFRAVLETRLAERMADAERAYWDVFPATGLTDQEWREMLQRIGKPLTWALWSIAVEEAARLAR